MSTYRELVRKYQKECSIRDIPEETVKRYLLELTQRDGINLYMDYEEEMPGALEEEFVSGMARILTHEPMEHVLGYSWFFGYPFIVNGDVLIPRVETEELVANILGAMDRIFPDNEVIETCDIGTGSGAIAITLVKEEPKVHMHATDISEEALVVARQNAEKNEADIDFVAGEMLNPLIERGIKVDVLVCNPPYIPQEEVLEESVKDFEPHVALFGGDDGLKFYRTIFENCHKLVKEKSFMAFEMGWNQREAMSELVSTLLPEAKFEILKDMNGKDRMLFVYFNC